MKEPREVPKSSGVRWLVDLREFGAGRKYFRTQAAAKRFQTQTLIEQSQIGQLAFDLPPETRRRYLALDAQATEIGTTLEAALAWWKKTHRVAEEKDLGSAIAECVAAKRTAGRRQSYLLQLSCILDSFRTELGPEKRCSDIGAGDVEKWLANPKWGQVTRHGRIGYVRAFFSFAARRGWVHENPVLKVEPISLNRRRPGILTVKQVQKLMVTCVKVDRTALPFFTLSIFCGLRVSEARVATWGQINLQRGYIEVGTEQSKTRERRIIKLQPNAIAWLKLGGELPLVDWWSRSARVKRKAGFALNGKGKGDPWPKNAMRHSFCSYCLPVFGELKESEWAGHSPQIAMSRYREIVTEEAAREFWAITPSASE